MKPGSAYPRNQALAILIGGAAGSGKSNLLFEFPQPYILDCEKNLRNAIERHPGKVFYYDDPEVGEDGAPLALEACWPRVEKLIKENASKPEVHTVAIDGLGRITDYLRAWLTHTGGKAEKELIVGGQKVMTMSLWGPFADLLKKLVFLCRAYQKPFLLTTHLGVDENELTAVKERRVLIQGSLRNDFPKLFTDFWLTNASPNSDPRYAPANGVRYFVRTAPDYQIMLKQSCGLPAEFEPSGEAFRKLITSITPRVAAPPAVAPTLPVGKPPPLPAPSGAPTPAPSSSGATNK